MFIWIKYALNLFNLIVVIKLYLSLLLFLYFHELISLIFNFLNTFVNLSIYKFLSFNWLKRTNFISNILIMPRIMILLFSIHTLWGTTIFSLAFRSFSHWNLWLSRSPKCKVLLTFRDLLLSLAIVNWALLLLSLVQIVIIIARRWYWLNLWLVCYCILIWYCMTIYRLWNTQIFLICVELLSHNNYWFNEWL